MPISRQTSATGIALDIACSNIVLVPLDEIGLLSLCMASFHQGLYGLLYPEYVCYMRRVNRFPNVINITSQVRVRGLKL